jgi:hypothetical protein
LCEDCIFGKHAHHPFDGVHEAEEEVGECTYIDLWGPGQVIGVSGVRYLMHLVEGHCGAPWVYFLAHKTAANTLEKFKLYVAEVETQTGKKIKRVRVDGGGEWMNKLWEKFCGNVGIIVEVMTPHSSSQNGLGERGIRTTVEFGRCLLTDSGFMKSMWPLVFEVSAYLQWFHPKRQAGGKTPWELYHGKKPDISHLRVFGATAYAKFVPIKAAGRKLNPRSVKARLVGFNKTAGYKLWNPATRVFFNSRDVIFEEGLGHRSLPPAGGDVEVAGGVEDEDGDVPHVSIPAVEPETDELAPAPADPPLPAAPTPVPPRRSTRATTPSKAILNARETDAVADAAKAARLNWATKHKTSNITARTQAAAAFTISTSSVPKSFHEAMEHPEIWTGPMEKEYGSLISREVWVLVDPPLGANIIDCKWVYAVKYDIEGAIIK